MKIMNNPLAKIINNSLINLPTPNNINLMWNWGSLLGLVLMIQIMSGLFLSMHYTANINLAFNSIIEISRDINQGNLMRLIHMNGASMFFIFIYFHLSRGMFFNSSKMKETWLSGVTILFILMGTAFVGYVLPWGQMSFWGTTVITNLMSVIPFSGKNIVKWIWGDFSVNNPTLNRFFSFHFILPLIMSAMVMIHLLFLHSSGSSNPSSIKLNSDKSSFHPLFSIKDINMMMIISILFLMMNCLFPMLLGDPENFNFANPLISPPHIQPEWYFLFAYAILRSIPNKMGGVLALVSAIMIFYLMPIFNPNIKSKKFIFWKKNIFLLFLSSAILLTWIGANPVETPFIMIGQLTSTFYFISFFIMN